MNLKIVLNSYCGEWCHLMTLFPTISLHLITLDGVGSSDHTNSLFAISFSRNIKKKIYF